MATEGGGKVGDGGEPAGGGEQPELPGEGIEDESEPARVGEYTWDDFKREFYYDENGDPPTDWRGNTEEFDPAEWLGFDPDELPARMDEGRQNAAKADFFLDFISTPVTKDEYTWTHFKYEFYLTDAGELPTDGDDVVPFDASEWLGFDADDTEETLAEGASRAAALRDIVDERTVNVDPDLDEDAFFSTFEGHTTVVNRYDLEKAVSMAKKRHFREVDRYWVNKPYAFVVLFHSEKENEKKYYLIEPYTTSLEDDLIEFLSGKLRTAIKYASEDVLGATGEEDRAAVIERETMRLLERYDLYAEESDSGTLLDDLTSLLGDDFASLLGDDLSGKLEAHLGRFADGSSANVPSGEAGHLAGIAARPEPAVLADDEETLTAYQVEKLLYQLERDFIGYERIDGIKHDINVEDISCDGYESPVFVYHTDYEQVISNVFHGTDELDNFVVKLAQRSGKGISKRQPQVDATLPDGSRAQLTLGREVSDHGTNYTIRQFKDVPFTPIDLINWHTFSLEEMALLWLCIENHKSLIFAGGTASGKTTSLNAVSLFIPSNTKIVSIEDTREVELPQRNWIASVTRPSFVEDGAGDVDEFDLLEAALRQRPDYIVMGEIRGEEGRTLFQVMSTGHTTYTTFHADSVGEVLKRFTTDPINVSKTMFTALDLVSVQTQTRVQGRKVRRNKSLTEINHYDAENDEINVRDVYEWRAETDKFAHLGNSNTLDEIKFDRGWDDEQLDDETFKRQVVLAYLIRENLNEYAQVAATLQAFINDPDTILGLIATDQLEASLEDLREMESVLIDIDPEKERMVPRPDPNDRAYELACEILAEAEERLFDQYSDAEPGTISTALTLRQDDHGGADHRPTPRTSDGPGIEDLLGGDAGSAETDEGSGLDDLLDEPDADGPSDGDPQPDPVPDDGFDDPTSASEAGSESSATPGDGSDRPGADGQPATDPSESGEETETPTGPEDSNGEGVLLDDTLVDDDPSESEADEGTVGESVLDPVPDDTPDEREIDEYETDERDRTATDDPTASSVASGDGLDRPAEESSADDSSAVDPEGMFNGESAVPTDDPEVDDRGSDRDGTAIGDPVIDDGPGTDEDPTHDDSTGDGVSVSVGEETETDDEIETGDETEANDEDEANDETDADDESEANDEDEGSDDAFGEFETVRFEDEEDT